jgi:hypothetical protein
VSLVTACAQPLDLAVNALISGCASAAVGRPAAIIAWICCCLLASKKVDGPLGVSPLLLRGSSAQLDRDWGGLLLCQHSVLDGSVDRVLGRQVGTDERDSDGASDLRLRTSFSVPDLPGVTHALSRKVKGTGSGAVRCTAPWRPCSSG